MSSDDVLDWIEVASKAFTRWNPVLCNKNVQTLIREEGGLSRSVYGEELRLLCSHTSLLTVFKQEIFLKLYGNLKIYLLFRFDYYMYVLLYLWKQLVQKLYM